MARHRRCRHWALRPLGLVVAVGLVVACSGQGKPSAPATVLGWSSGAAQSANGRPQGFTAVQTCGSDHATYLAELLNTSPTDVKVLHEWGDIVFGGKQVLVSGRVATTHLGPTDLPVSHPYGDDLSMDVALDKPFLPFTRSLGPAEGPAGQMHVELSAGLIPHQPRPSSAVPGQTWRQLSDFNLTGFQPGFDLPAVGDRIVVMGRWIVDCGHPNYQTELHPMTFVAWAHQAGSTTVVHTYYNPYRDTQLYSPDAASLGRVGDQSRFARSDSQPFPRYLIGEVLRMISGGGANLRSQELLEENRTSPVPLQVCAPAGTAGHNVDVRYDLVARPGVEVKVTPEAGIGCASVQVTVTPAYTAADATVRSCVLPWTYLNLVARQALDTTVDVKSVIDSNVPDGVRPAVDRDPATSCSDALAGPAVAPAPTGQSLRTDPGQPFPVYGTVTIQRT